MSDIDTVKAIYQAMGARDFDKIFELIDETLRADPGRAPAVGRSPRGPGRVRHLRAHAHLDDRLEGGRSTPSSRPTAR